MAGSSIRAGIRSGLRAGLRSGINEFGDSAWAVDGVSGKPLPNSATQWAAFIAANSLAISGPSSIYRLDEASGNPVDSGPAAKNLTASASPLYQRPVTGWSKTGIEFTNTTNQRLANTAYSDAATTSLLALIYYHSTAVPGATTNIFTYGTSNIAAGLSRLNTDRIRYRNGASIVDYGAALSSPAPIVFKHDVTNLSAMSCTDALKLAPAYAAAAGTRFDLAATTGNSDLAVMFYCWVWSGAAAEMSDANVKLLLQALGWTVAW